MLAKVTRGFHITGIKVLTDHTTIYLAHATHRSAFKNMDTTILDVLDQGHLLEEYIYR